MYSLKIFTDSRNCIDAVVSGKTILELCERYYLYHQMHGGGYYLDMYENDKLASRELFDQWCSTYNKYFKERKRLQKMGEDF
ncbi:MAG: hypothetical protein J6V44_14270 [Methanobrevibacter sp.]|nr:hypothetical protein [Methanobrevibacter sp.]